MREKLGEERTLNESLKMDMDKLEGVKANLEAEILKLDDKINNYRINLLDKDEEIKEKEKTICELENLVVLIHDKNNKLESEATKNDDFWDTPTNPNKPQNTQSLETLIKSWKRQSKVTRDWTKANQLISELENLL